MPKLDWGSCCHLCILFVLSFFFSFTIIVHKEATKLC
jgi:hypothetical protein